MAAASGVGPVDRLIAPSSPPAEPARFEGSRSFDSILEIARSRKRPTTVASLRDAQSRRTDRPSADDSPPVETKDRDAERESPESLAAEAIDPAAAAAPAVVAAPPSAAAAADGTGNTGPQSEDATGGQPTIETGTPEATSPGSPESLVQPVPGNVVLIGVPKFTLPGTSPPPPYSSAPIPPQPLGTQAPTDVTVALETFTTPPVDGVPEAQQDETLETGAEFDTTSQPIPQRTGANERAGDGVEALQPAKLTANPDIETAPAAVESAAPARKSPGATGTSHTQAGATATSQAAPVAPHAESRGAAESDVQGQRDSQRNIQQVTRRAAEDGSNRGSGQTAHVKSGSSRLADETTENARIISLTTPTTGSQSESRNAVTHLTTTENHAASPAHAAGAASASTAARADSGSAAAAVSVTASDAAAQTPPWLAAIAPKEEGPVTIDRLGPVIRGHIDEGRWQMRIQLDPPELGRVHLDVAMNDDKLAVRLQVATEQVRRLVDAHLPDLVRSLGERDVQVAPPEVVVRSPAADGLGLTDRNRDDATGRHLNEGQGQPSQGWDRPAGHESGRGDGQGRATEDSWRWRGAGAGANVALARSAMRSDGRLDLVA